MLYKTGGRPPPRPGAGTRPLAGSRAVAGTGPPSLPGARRPTRSQRTSAPDAQHPSGSRHSRLRDAAVNWFTGVVLRSREEIAKMRRAGRVVAEMHAATRAAARPGVTTADLDRVARDVLERRGARSNFLNYHGFPAVICTSPNNMIVHGIPGDYQLAEGDILSIDCGAIVEGYHGDAAFTMGIGAIDPVADKLIKVTEESLWAGIEQIRPGNRLHDIGLAVQTVAEGAGFSVVREYVGHAIGTAMHEDPQVPNYWPGRPGPLLKTGMVFAVEPMVNAGGPETVQLDDGWSVVTADGSLSAHFEHTIAVTDDGPEVLTLPD